MESECIGIRIFRMFIGAQLWKRMSAVVIGFCLVFLRFLVRVAEYRCLELVLWSFMMEFEVLAQLCFMQLCGGLTLIFGVNLGMGG